MGEGDNAQQLSARLSELRQKGDLETKEAVEYIRIVTKRPFAVQTLYNLCSRKEGPRKVRRRGRCLFPVRDLDAWISNETEAVAAYA